MGQSGHYHFGITDIVQCIARSIDGRRTSQAQILHIVAQRIRERTVHGINPLIGLLYDEVASIIDDVDIITASTVHGVDVQTSIEHVITVT